MKRIAFLLATTLASLAPARAAAGIDLELSWRASADTVHDAAVILYEERNFRGRRLILYPGEEWADFDDYVYDFRVRSVEVFGPVHVTLFDESGFWGHETVVTRDVRDLRDLRMRLNRYSTINWSQRARSAYVSFTPRNHDIRFSLGYIHPRVYCAAPRKRVYYTAPRQYRYHAPRPPVIHRPPPVPSRPHPGYRPPPRPGNSRSVAVPPSPRATPESRSPANRSAPPPRGSAERPSRNAPDVGAPGSSRTRPPDRVEPSESREARTAPRRESARSAPPSAPPSSRPSGGSRPASPPPPR